jgi:undecaprenyl-diphosphatase
MFQHIDTLELTICQALNRRLCLSGVRPFFTVVSRLGDGGFWYALMIALPLVYGWSAVPAAAQMAVTGAVASGVYAFLKGRFVRERPYVTFASIDCTVAPLDRYSFPSGHTLHAVCFSAVAMYHLPELGWLLVPFTTLVMLSRVVLGLHYPTDVLAGSVIGLALATLSLALLGV